MSTLQVRFRLALRTEYGPRRLSSALDDVSDAIWAARDQDVPWDQLARYLSVALDDEGRPRIDADTLRGLMGRKKNRGMKAARAGGSQGHIVSSDVTSSESLPSESPGRIEAIGLRRAKIRELDKETN